MKQVRFKYITQYFNNYSENAYTVVKVQLQEHLICQIIIIPFQIL